MSISWRRAAVSLVVVAVAAGGLSSCEVARAGQRCRTTKLAQDQTHVLACRRGRWTRVMTKAQAGSILAELAARNTTTTAPTTTTQPASTTTSTEPTTTTTTLPPTPTITRLAAYPLSASWDPFVQPILVSTDATTMVWAAQYCVSPCGGFGDVRNELVVRRNGTTHTFVTPSAGGPASPLAGAPLDLSADGRWLLGLDRIVDLNTMTDSALPTITGSQLQGISMSGDGSKVFGRVGLSTLYVWEPSSDVATDVTSRVPSPNNPDWRMADDGEHVLARAEVNATTAISRVNLTTGAVQSVGDGLSSPTSMSFDGSCFATAPVAGQSVVPQLYDLSVSTQPVAGLPAGSPSFVDGTCRRVGLLVAGTNSGQIAVYDRVIHEMVGGPGVEWSATTAGGVPASALSGDGQVLVTQVQNAALTDDVGSSADLRVVSVRLG